MILDPHAREYGGGTITTTPVVAPDQWEASIDDGQTWTPALDLNGESLWLFAGPECDQPPVDGQINLTGSVRPLLRVIDNPEVVVRSPFAVRLTS